MRLVLATANPDKAEELAAILADELGGAVELVARAQRSRCSRGEWGDARGQRAAQGSRPLSRRPARPR